MIGSKQSKASIKTSTPGLHCEVVSSSCILEDNKVKVDVGFCVLKPLLCFSLS